MLIYGSRSLEPTQSIGYRSLLVSPQVQRIYLDELGDWRQQPLGLGLMLLTIAAEIEAPDRARFLLNQAQQLGQQSVIMELISTILVYKFANLGWEEIAAMLNIQDVELEQTRAYQQIEERQGRNVRESFVVMQLTEKLGDLPEPLKAQLAIMSVTKLEKLGKALLHFQGLRDLETWLVDHA